MTATAPEQVRDLFDRIAPVYDRFNDRLSFGLHRVWKQMTVNWSGARPGDRVLDLCCGSGDLAVLLARRVGRDGAVTGLDFSQELLNQAARRPDLVSLPLTIDWKLGDALRLPQTDASIDAITMGYGLRNVGDIPRALAEIRRVLKPGRRAALLDMHRPEETILRGFQQWYLEHWVQPAANDCGLHDEYAYIGPSLDRFPTGPEQEALARQVGFRRVRHYPIAAGMMGVLVVEA